MEGSGTVVRVELYDGLNDEQARAVAAGDGVLVIVAGPGSGKTTVLTRRIARLIDDGVPPSSILAVTFTNKAAAEMRTRVETLLGGETPMPQVATFHSTCLRIVRRWHTAAGLPAGFGIADRADSVRIARRALDAVGAASDEADARALLRHLSLAKNRLEPVAAVVAGLPGASRLVAAAEEYQRQLHTQGLCDFDDLLVICHRLLAGHDDIRSFYQQRLRHVLVDEFQDTCPVQYQIALLLSGGHRNLCVVGDRDQSVYQFRAADPSVMDRILAEHPDAQVVVLEQNYRSSEPILALARAVIAADPAPHRPSLRTARTDGDAPVGVICDDDHDEAELCARICADGDETAVLVRTNAQTRLIEEALVAAGIAYQVVGTVKFYQRSEIRDALAWARWAVNPADAVSAQRAAGAPTRGVGDKAFQAVLDLAGARGVSVADALAQGLADEVFPSRSRRALADLDQVYRRVVAAADQGPAALLGACVTTTGLRQALAARAGEQDRVDNLDELAGSVRTTGGGLAGCVQLLEQIALVDTDDNVEGAGAVTVLTAHAAKGKEFDTVVVAGVEDGLFPHDRTVGDPDAQAEERRLLYVAITRARHRLVLTRALRRLRYGRYVDTEASPLLAHIPGGLLTWGGQRPVVAEVAGDTGRGPRRPVSSAAVSAGRTLPRESWQPGVQVTHPKFGDGTLTTVAGEVASVAFADGSRQLLLSVAPLRPAGR
jgi:DNA helicase II / ATP-dependent DNA helicase PcrA